MSTTEPPIPTRRPVLRAVPVTQPVRQPATGKGGGLSDPLRKGSASAARLDPMARARAQASHGLSKDKGFQKLLGGLRGADKTAGRKKAALAMADWTRSNMVDQKQLQAYLSRTDITEDQKSATLGQLAVAMNRSELVLGRSYAGGNGSWEDKGKNKGGFVDYYQSMMGKASNSDAWCTKFAGHAYQRLGFDRDYATSGSKTPFWSGLRLDKWARDGKSVGPSKQILSSERTLGSDKTAGDVISGRDFRSLTQGVSKARGTEKRGAAVNDWVAKNGAPRPGDIIVRDPGNAVNGSSHTIMVESYDPKTGTIQSVEGNASDKVQGFSYDLRDPKVAGQMSSLMRMDPKMFAGGRGQGDGRVEGRRTPVTAAELVGRANAVNDHLIGVAGKRGWVKSADPNASSAQLTTGGANSWPKNGGSTR